MTSVAEKPRTTTRNGHPVLVSNLRIFPLTGESYGVIDTESYSILCHGWRGRHSATIMSPISFKDGIEAQKWIDSGTIGELQESLGNLMVCFTNQLIIPPGFMTASVDPDYNRGRLG